MWQYKWHKTNLFNAELSWLLWLNSTFGMCQSWSIDEAVFESNWSNVLSMSIIWSSGIGQLPRKFCRDASLNSFLLMRLPLSTTNTNIGKWFTIKTQFSKMLALHVLSFGWTFFSIFVFCWFYTKNSLNSHYLATETSGIRWNMMCNNCLFRLLSASTTTSDIDSHTSIKT